MTDRYDVSGLPEAQFEKGSRNRVLRNKLGIKSKRVMDETEVAALQSAMDKLITIYDSRHRFTTADIRYMHKLWLCDIYEWAGEYRQVNLSKDAFNFASSRQIPLLMRVFGKEFLKEHTPCTFKSTDRVIQALSEVHVELVLIHPFREGNGRVARMLSIFMGLQAELPPLDFSIIVKNKSSYISAIHSGLKHDYEPMKDVFENVIRKTLRTRRQT